MASASTAAPSALQVQDALRNVIHADDAQSTALPNGTILWTFADTTSVNGISTVSGDGYPHNAMAVQAAGTLRFTVKHGKYGYGWQQVPNWSDGSYFWMSTPAVDARSLYVLGERVKTVGGSFKVVGPYMAKFNAATLAYEGVEALPKGATGTTIWGGIMKAASGWRVTGTHAVPCSHATNCKAGDVAWVKFGQLANARDWHITNNAVSAKENLGTTLAPVATASRKGGWELFTKVGDAYGGTTIERLVSTTNSFAGPWTVDRSWAAPSPSGTVTYGVAAHPEQAAPSGDRVITYDVNGVSDEYYPRFLTLPVK